MFRLNIRKLALTILSVMVVGLVQAKTAAVETTGVIRVAQLPAQGQETYQLIFKGGPFPYDKDGSVFGNRERLLPAKPRGFWREYTVKTPGERTRGARRIVCGGKPQTPEVCYYSADHYASFRMIVQ